MIDSTKMQETPPGEVSEMAKVVLEAGRVATEKMLDYYRRMGDRGDAGDDAGSGAAGG